MDDFRLRARVEPGLPRLAWCARVRARCPEVVVCHGADVERTEHALVDGAWDGDYGEMAFDAATFMAGTGVRLRSDRLRFVAGTGRMHRIYAARRGDDLFVSNSLTFTLVAAGEQPRSARADYAAEIRRQIADDSHEHTPYALKFGGGDVELFEMRDLEVGRSLTMTSVPKKVTPEPRCYDEVLALLDGVAARTMANAADAARRRRYAPLATVSRGYDAASAAVFAARHGCREALTFSESRPGVADPDDDGTLIGERLGLTVHRRARDAWRARTDLPEAEWCATPPAKLLALSSVEDDLAGRLFLTGHFGDHAFEMRIMSRAGMRVRANAMSATQSTQEMRLRVGFVLCSPFFVLRAHKLALRALSRGDELASHRIGGDYDRPIPRRILEEAGVDRALFGNRKMARLVSEVQRKESLSATSRRDFAAFVASHHGLSAIDKDMALRRLAALNIQRAHRVAQRGLSLLGLPALPRLREWPSLDDPRLFHWGLAHTRRRYEGRTP